MSSPGPGTPKVFYEMTPELTEAYRRMSDDLEELRAQGKFEQCLEEVVALAKKHPRQSAPMFMSAYNQHYRLAVAHLPPARLKRLNARINQGEFTIEQGWDAPLNEQLSGARDAMNRKAQRQAERHSCVCGNPGSLLCGRCKKQNYCR